MPNRIFMPSWMRVMCLLPIDNKLSATYKLNMTYSSVHNIISDFKKRGWVKTGKNGRTVKVVLTDKGKNVQQYIGKIRVELNGRV